MAILQQDLSNISQYFSYESLWITCAWFVALVILERLVFALKGKGVVLRNGEQLSYNLNGHLSFWIVVLVLGFGQIYLNKDFNVVQVTSVDLSFLYDDYLKLAFSAIIFSTLLSIFLYVYSFKPGSLLALGGNSGNAIFDFFIGRELNPRIGSFDLKQFCELRPGLIGWALINVGCCQKQLALNGAISKELFMVTLFQNLYVWDALYNEKAILTTMDITSDGFGFMLAFGDLVWVPFTYTLQARYLVESSSSSLPSSLFIFACCLNLLGYFIFRQANSEKDRFRTDPNAKEVAHLKYLKTESGRKLLISGWWGLARKINYTGDWMMALSWSLFTGFETPMTYFYPIYFFILLVHRASRDDHMCFEKYGKDWAKYKKQVPYIFIPGVI